MEENKKMNVVVLGVSGSGKSTLIKSISGSEILTGVGSGQTQNINIYESSTWPIRLIDTKGFEYSIIEQWKTINQVKKYSKKQLASSGIDVVWYCLEGTSGRIFKHNINMMSKAMKNWKNIPVFVVITKSYSKKDIDTNISAVDNLFRNVKGINLKGIIPVVAEEYQINDEVIVPPFGIEQLCLKTLDCQEEAIDINKSNRDRMVLEQKRFSAYTLVLGASASAVVIGAVPIPIPDSTVLMPLESGMVKTIFKIYDVQFSNDLILAIVGSTIITDVARFILKMVPIAGPVINSIVAATIVYALGEAVILASEGAYKGTIDPEKSEDFCDFIANTIKTSAIVGATISYLEENADKLKDKKGKEIFKEIIASVSTKSK